MWPSAHLQMPLRAYFVSFRSINSLTPCRAYNIQRTHKGQRDAAPWRHHRVVGKRKPGTPLQPELKLITLPPTSLTECTLPAWHSKAKMMRAYHLPSLRGRNLHCLFFSVTTSANGSSSLHGRWSGSEKKLIFIKHPSWEHIFKYRHICIIYRYIWANRWGGLCRIWR